MSPDPKDYGREGDGAALVPGSLVVYRHFQIDLEAGVLLPMNYRPPKAGRYHPPAWRYSRYNTYPAPQQVWMTGMRPPKVPATYHAQCVKMSPSAYMAQAFAEARGKTHDESPTVWCTCGFYAHYDPDTDFYPSHRWGRLYNRLAGTEEQANLVVVRAVCEVSGKVIMGTLGVRAAKIKILALGIDWEKRISPTEVDRFNWEMNRRAREVLDWESNPPSLRFSRSWGPDERDDDAVVGVRVEAIAAIYGVKHYQYVADMYADYPKPDVSALIEESKPPEPEPEQWEIGFDTTPLVNTSVQWGKVSSLKEVFAASPFGHQVALYANGVKTDTRKQRGYQGLKPYLAWMDEVFPSGQVIVDEVEVEVESMTPFERVMLKKRNKSAPPGTGIDRRRGRLR